MKGRRNIYKVLEQADRFDINEGRLAYQRYHELCQQIAKKYLLRFETVVAIVAATSPNNSYKANMRSAVSIIDGFAKGLGPEDIVVSGYGHCKERAYTYLQGVDFLGTVEGPKIRNFYFNIINPFDPYPVTIDGHAVNIWRGVRQNLKKVTTDRGFDYNEVADDFRFVAQKEGLLPNQLQAICWFTWKRINKIIYRPQLSLLRPLDDVWETLIRLEDLRPYEKTEVKNAERHRGNDNGPNGRGNDSGLRTLFDVFD